MEQKALIFNSVCVACRQNNHSFSFDVCMISRDSLMQNWPGACQSLRRLSFMMTIM